MYGNWQQMNNRMPNQAYGQNQMQTPGPGNMNYQQQQWYYQQQQQNQQTGQWPTTQPQQQQQMNQQTGQWPSTQPHQQQQQTNQQTGQWSTTQPPLPTDDVGGVNPAPPMEPPDDDKPPLPAGPPPEPPKDDPPKDQPQTLAPVSAEEQDKLNALKAQAARWQQYTAPAPAPVAGYNAAQPPELQAVMTEEKEFEEQYKTWRKQYEDWKDQNKNHPNQEQFLQYEQQWKQYEQQMETRKSDIQTRKFNLINPQNTGYPNIQQQYGGYNQNFQRFQGPEPGGNPRFQGQQHFGASPGFQGPRGPGAPGGPRFPNDNFQGPRGPRPGGPPPGGPPRMQGNWGGQQNMGGMNQNDDDMDLDNDEVDKDNEPNFDSNFSEPRFSNQRGGRFPGPGNWRGRGGEHFQGHRFGGPGPRGPGPRGQVPGPRGQVPEPRGQGPRFARGGGRGGSLPSLMDFDVKPSPDDNFEDADDHDIEEDNQFTSQRGRGRGSGPFQRGGRGRGGMATDNWGHRGRGVLMGPPHQGHRMQHPEDLDNSEHDFRNTMGGPRFPGMRGGPRPQFGQRFLGPNNIRGGPRHEFSGGPANQTKVDDRSEDGLPTEENEPESNNEKTDTADVDNEGRSNTNIALLDNEERPNEDIKKEKSEKQEDAMSLAESNSSHGSQRGGYRGGATAGRGQRGAPGGMHIGRGGHLDNQESEMLGQRFGDGRGRGRGARGFPAGRGESGWIRGGRGKDNFGEAWGGFRGGYTGSESVPDDEFNEFDEQYEDEEYFEEEYDPFAIEGGFEGRGRGGFEGRGRGGFESRGRGGFESRGRGGFDGRGRGGFEGRGRGGFESRGRGGFESRGRGGFEGRGRGGFRGRGGPENRGRGLQRGGPENFRGRGLQRGGRGARGGFGAERGGFGAERGGFGAERGGFGAERGGYGTERGGFGLQRGGSGALRGWPGELRGGPGASRGGQRGRGRGGSIGGFQDGSDDPKRFPEEEFQYADDGEEPQEGDTALDKQQEGEQDDGFQEAPMGRPPMGRPPHPDFDRPPHPDFDRPPHPDFPDRPPHPDFDRPPHPDFPDRRDPYFDRLPPHDPYFDDRRLDRLPPPPPEYFDRLRDPFDRDPFARDRYHSDPYRDRLLPPRDPLYDRDPYARDPYARDPYLDPYARERDLDRERLSLERDRLPIDRERDPYYADPLRNPYRVGDPFADTATPATASPVADAPKTVIDYGHGRNKSADSKSPERSRSSERSRDNDRDRDRGRNRDRDRERDRDRDRDRERHREREKLDKIKKLEADREKRRLKDRERLRDRVRDRLYGGEWNKDLPSRDSPPTDSGPRIYQSKIETAKVEDLLIKPGRLSRPPSIVVIVRGLPGSGKTYVSKLIRDKEISNGGAAPRMLCLDDYFMVEVEKKEKDPETSKQVVTKVLEYQYEPEVEEAYRQSLYKSFKKTIDDGFFPFIVIDAIHEKVKHFEEFWSYAKSKGFQVYIVEVEADVSTCIKRNIHSWQQKDVEKIKKNWEITPSHFMRLDIRYLLQEDCINEVEMEDESTDNGKTKEEGDDEDDEIERIAGGYRKSKWEMGDKSETHMDKLDGIRKRKRTASPQGWDDYLEIAGEDYFSRTSTPGRKRVRWVDIEEHKQQLRQRQIGFVIGQTQRDWDRITDDNFAHRAMNQTKYI